MDDKSSLKGARSGHVNHINFNGHNHISEAAEAIVVNFCTQAAADDKQPVKEAPLG